MTLRTRSVLADLSWEQQHWQQGVRTIVGLDEVGRGAFAGPLVVGAVAVTPDQQLHVPPVADSKLVPASRRQPLAEHVQRWAEGWSVGVVTSDEIDQIGMGASLRVAARRALEQLQTQGIVIDVVGVDGPVAWVTRDTVNPDTTIEAVQGGDRTSAAIASASLIAKVWRDHHMVEQHQQWPVYGFDHHVGYGTPGHKHAIGIHGLCPIHRSSWRINH